MTHLPENTKAPLNDIISRLEAEIASLENDLQKTEADLNAFESQIRAQLHSQIKKIRELTMLYKAQKLAKKIKRLEQKKKGKNYQEPKGIKKVTGTEHEEGPVDEGELQELKRLYKEAIVHVHPDKFANEGEGISERANDLTVQLNSIYKRGNLDELSQFHEHILSGNAMSHISFKSETIVDRDALIDFLKNKKENLLQTIAETKQSQTYIVLSSHSSPQDFIEELKIQFEQRILQLEKRTRKG